MERTVATAVRNEALRAIEALSSSLQAALRGCDQEEYGCLHKQVGQVIGQIQMGILEPIVAQHPDLDDLR